MEQGEIVRACMARGLLVSGEDLKRIEAGMSIDELLASKQMQQPQQEERAGKLTYRFWKTKQKETVTPSDILEQQKNRYETIKGLLLSKTSAISINNARDNAASVSLIGMVRQVTENGFVLEDFTDEIDVACEGSKPAAVDEGDVISVRGPVKNGKLLCKDIIYPDVPLLRPIGRIDASLLLITKQAKPATGSDVILSTNPIESDAKNIIINASPSHLGIYKDGRKVNVLFYRTEGEMDQQAAINMLKKRGLKKGRGFVADGEAYLMEPVPDILWIVGKGRDWIETYKGVSIIHTQENSEKQAFIDLRTREAKLI